MEIFAAVRIVQSRVEVVAFCSDCLKVAVNAFKVLLFAGDCGVGRAFGAGRAGSVDAGKRGGFGVNPTEHRVCLFAGGAYGFFVSSFPANRLPKAYPYF